MSRPYDLRAFAVLLRDERRRAAAPLPGARRLRWERRAIQAVLLLGMARVWLRLAYLFLKHLPALLTRLRRPLRSAP